MLTKLRWFHLNELTVDEVEVLACVLSSDKYSSLVSLLSTVMHGLSVSQLVQFVGMPA